MQKLSPIRANGLPPVLGILVGLMTGIQILMSFGPVAIRTALIGLGAFFTDFSDANTVNVIMRIPTLFTYALLHGGWLHLIFNCMLLIHLGRGVATLMRTRRFLYFFALCAAGGAIFHMGLTDHNSILVGASASVFGVAAARGILLSRQFVNQADRKRYIIQYSAGWMILNITIILFTGLSANTGGNPFITDVAWQAHIGGYLVGLAVAEWYM